MRDKGVVYSFGWKLPTSLISYGAKISSASQRGWMWSK